MRKLLVVLALLGAVVACTGSHESLTSPTAGNPAIFGTVRFEGDFVVVTVENASRADFALEVYNKNMCGETRCQAGLLATFPVPGNGVYRFNLSPWACLPVQTDLVSPGGGILRDNSRGAIGACPVDPPAQRPVPVPTPTPSPSPSPCPTGVNPCDPPPPPPVCDELHPELCPPPPPPVVHGACYYNVPGRAGKETCENTPGFLSWEDQNHLCGLTFPGVAQQGFNLNPGQSDPDCLRKQDAK